MSTDGKIVVQQVNLGLADLQAKLTDNIRTAAR